MDAKMWLGVVFSGLSRTAKAMEAVSYWKYNFSLVSIKRFYKDSDNEKPGLEEINSKALLVGGKPQRYQYWG